MHIERVSTSFPVEPAQRSIQRRSLASRFVFVIQNKGVQFGAESCIDVLRAANRLTGSGVYRWEIINGDSLARDGQACGPEDVLVLVGGLETPWLPSRPVLRSLRESMRSAARVCVVGSAIFVPLQAGLIGSKRVAVHPGFRPGAYETTPDLDIAESATCHHSTLSSSVTPASAIRMMVELVGAREGDYTLAALAEYIGLSDSPSEESCGEYWQLKRQARGDEIVEAALAIMVDHLEDTLSIAQIAQALDMSQRRLERAFRHQLACSPLNVYRDLRLDRARKLVRQTSLSLKVVPIACGFSSFGLMKKWYLKKYKETPQQTREISFNGLEIS